MNMNVPRLFLFALIVFAATPAVAMRCRGKLVDEGDPQVRVLAFCGEPTSMQRRTIYRSGITSPWVNRQLNPADPGEPGTQRDELLFADRSVVEVKVEEWIYNFGPNRLMQLVRFEDGLVAAIDRLGYGYPED
jgi:hypothetical protein